VSFVILEQAAAVGARWRHHYDRLHLHSDRAYSALPYLRFPPGTPRYPSREQLIAYLERYARELHIDPRFNERAQSVRPRMHGWLTTTTAGSYRSRSVVVATGCNAVPNLPD
jgi:cation diffusion facilitator CzcD-associated flavoprotein CzcO